MSFDLSNSKWIIRELSSVSKINPSRTEIKGFSDNLLVSFVPMKAVSEKGGIVKPEIRTLKEVKKGYTYFKEHDVLFAKITPCMENGKSAIARNLKNGLGFGSTEFHVIRANGDVLPEWIYYYVRQANFRKTAETTMTGTAGQQRVPKEFLNNTKIPIPPKTEQKTIIKKIQKLMGKLDEVENLKDLTQLKIEEIFPNYLNYTIKKLMEENKSVEIEKITESHKQGYYTEESYVETGIKLARITDMLENGELSYEKMPSLDIDKKTFEQFKIMPKDLLFARSGSIGRCALVRKKIPVIFASYVIRFRFCLDKVRPDFVSLFIRSPIGTSKLLKKKHGSANKNINAENIKSISIPLPSLEKQDKIIKKTQKIYSIFDSLRKNNEMNREKIGDLSQSILNQAFLGKLN